MGTTKIEWTDHTLNLVMGCKQVDATCDNCYAMKFFNRYHHNLEEQGKGWNSNFRLLIKSWRAKLQKIAAEPGTPKVFVSSLSDIFDNDFALINAQGDLILNKDGTPRTFDQERQEFFALAANMPHVTLMLLTQRPGNITRWLPKWGAPANFWIGTSAGTQETFDRGVAALSKVQAKVRFLSLEPLLEPIDLDGKLDGIHWIIVGGESGPGARPMEAEWVRNIIKDCNRAGIPCFFKQWGTVKNNPDPNDPTILPQHESYAKGGCQLDGWRIQNFPTSQEGATT